MSRQPQLPRNLIKHPRTLNPRASAINTNFLDAIFARSREREEPLRRKQQQSPDLYTESCSARKLFHLEPSQRSSGSSIGEVSGTTCFKAPVYIAELRYENEHRVSPLLALASVIAMCGCRRVIYTLSPPGDGLFRRTYIYSYKGIVCTRMILPRDRLIRHGYTVHATVMLLRAYEF